MRGLHLPIGSAVPYNCLIYNRPNPLPEMPSPDVVLSRGTNADPQRTLPLWLMNRSAGLQLPALTRIRRMTTTEQRWHPDGNPPPPGAGQLMAVGLSV